MSCLSGSYHSLGREDSKLVSQIEHPPYPTNPKTAIQILEDLILGSQIEHHLYPKTTLQGFDIQIESHSRFRFDFQTICSPLHLSFILRLSQREVILYFTFSGLHHFEPSSTLVSNISAKARYVILSSCSETGQTNKPVVVV